MAKKQKLRPNASNFPSDTLTKKRIMLIMITHCKKFFYMILDEYWERGELEMYVKEVTVQNQVGLHARPATFFIQKANEFKSSIWVEKDERRVNAKSLLGVLSLGIVGGTDIRIIADGLDEQLAVDSLVRLVENGFTE